MVLIILAHHLCRSLAAKAENFALRTICDWPDLFAVEYTALIGSHVDGGFLQHGNAQIAGRYNPANGALSLSQFDFDGYFSGVRVNVASVSIAVRSELLMAILLFVWAVRAKLMNWKSLPQFQWICIACYYEDPVPYLRRI